MTSESKEASGESNSSAPQPEKKRPPSSEELLASMSAEELAEFRSGSWYTDMTDKSGPVGLVGTEPGGGDFALKHKKSQEKGLSRSWAAMSLDSSLPRVPKTDRP